MNELLKTKYYSLIENKCFNQYEKIGNTLAIIENRLIDSNSKTTKAEFVKLALPIMKLENVY